MKKSRFRETPGFLELAAGRVAAWLILFASRRQAARRDYHELNHSIAVAAVGNTGHDGCGPDCVFRDLTHVQVTALVVALTAGRLNTGTGEPIR